MLVQLIVAYDENRVIGKDNKLPWHLPEDLKLFKEKTKGHVVLMGYKTYESIPEKFRPLRDRLNVVLTRKQLALSPIEQYHRAELLPVYVNTFDEAIAVAKTHNPDAELWIIGGAEVYKAAIDANLPDQIVASEVYGTHEGDTYFPQLPSAYIAAANMGTYKGFRVVTYVNTNKPPKCPHWVRSGSAWLYGERETGATVFMEKSGWTAGIVVAGSFDVNNLEGFDNVTDAQEAAVRMLREECNKRGVPLPKRNDN